MIAQFAFTIGSEEEVVRMCLGSGRVHTAWRHGVGQCVEGAIGVGRQGKTCLSLLKGKEMGKWTFQLDPLGENPPPTAGNVPPTTCRPQVVPPRGPPGAGVGSPPTPESPPSPPSEELVKALQLLQSVLTPEDSSKCEKKKPIVRNRNRSIWR